MDRRIAQPSHASRDRRAGADRRTGTDRRSASRHDGAWSSYRFLAATFAAQILGQGNPSREKPASPGHVYAPVYSRLPLRPLFVDKSI